MLKDGRLICDQCGLPMTVARYDDHYNIWYRPRDGERSVLIDICAECAEKMYKRKKQIEHDKEGTND